MTYFEPLDFDQLGDELLKHLAADERLVPYQPGMVLPAQCSLEKRESGNEGEAVTRSG